ncbi:hypothetical protein [Vibrio hepatarius]|uniref:hypothetical protein n=1 Tax=Vibrio hepatarius TaxID=171383 RepID=UPI001C08AD9F|nr:hypothetical protein [Vibrio hepatarius]MBU2897648.1 hypothetical protein [Vibrio hepatarius]
MEYSLFEYALKNDECNSFFKGKDDYYQRSERDEHEYGTNIWIVLNDIKSGRVSCEDFSNQFGIFVQSLNFSDEDRKHFFQNVHCYLTNVYKYKEIDKDILFSNPKVELVVKDYLKNNCHTEYAQRFIRSVQDKFPKAIVISYTNNED